MLFCFFFGSGEARSQHLPGAKDMQSLLAGMLTKAQEVGRVG